MKKDKFPLIFGSDWVFEIDIFLHNLKSVYVKEIESSSDKLKALLNAFSDLFTNKVEEIKG